jgi:serine protease Do
MPGVVFIDVQSAGQRVLTGFGELQEPPREGSGSGFIFRADGYVLTNNHVVEGADRVTVVTQDRREFSARVVGRDPNTDLAVLKIDARGLPVVRLADSDGVEVGDWVVAVGYPLQLGATATAGIISAKGRTLGILNDQAASLEHYIQTDAAINPGNSGGPLVDLQGRVVGVNSAIKSATGFYSGYGFAIPSNLAERVANDLIEHGVVRRPRLGVLLGEVSAADAAVYSLPRAAGAEVTEVSAGDSPARRAGFRLGDVIVAVNGEPVETGGALMEKVALLEPGAEVAFDVIRYGERMRLNAQLGQFEVPANVRRSTAALPQPTGIEKLGFEALPLTPQIARQLRTSATEGVVVSGVVPTSPAAHAALQRGQVISEINGKRVDSVEDVEAVARTLKPGASVSLILTMPDGNQRILNYQVRT